MRSPVTGLLLCAALLVLVFVDAWRKRRDKTADDWILLLIGTTMLLAGTALLLASSTIYSERHAVGAVLKLAGVVVVMVPLIRTVKRVRPPIEDARLLAICKRTALVLVVATVGGASLFPLLSALLPDLQTSAACIAGRSLSVTLVTSGSVCTMVLVVWYYLMRHRPFPSPITRRVLAPGVPLIVVATYVPIMLRVYSAATDGLYPSAAIAAAISMVLLVAAVEAAGIACFYWMALWGLAAGA